MTDYGSYDCSVQSPDATKDPDDTIDYAFNWAAWLDGDTISASDFILPDGLTEESSSFSDTGTQIFVSGGTCGSTYRITNRITTLGGRVKDKTINVVIRES